MTDYLTIAEAREATALRLVGLRGVPSPWTEAARGIFYVKRLDCRYAAPSREEPDAITDWMGNSSIPVVAFEREKPRTGGDALSAADINWATFANLLTPLPEDLLPAAPMIREVYSGTDAEVREAVTERLRQHQNHVYQTYLELPVPL